MAAERKTRMTKRLVMMGLIWLLVPGGVALGNETSGLRVVTTISPITAMVQRVAGNRAEVYGLVPAGVNSHTFQPTPRDIRYLARADLIILNGLYLEIPTEKLSRSHAKGWFSTIRKSPFYLPKPHADE